MTRRRLTLAALVVVISAVAAAAQFGGGFGRFRRFPPRVPASDASFDGGFNFCRVMYTGGRREAGGQGWSTDYPDADINFSIRFSELTKTRVSRQADTDAPSHFTVRLTDPWLGRCPFVLASDVGTMTLNEAEVAALRDYLLKGGFLWVDDFWGTRAWDQWAGEMKKVLPEYDIVDVPANHAIRTSMFTITTVKQVTSINFWRRSGGDTSERGADSPHANFRMIADPHGRILVLMTHNTDIGDSWEREGEDHDFFLQFSPEGYALGVNAVLYALSH